MDRKNSQPATAATPASEIHEIQSAGITLVVAGQIRNEPAQMHLTGGFNCKDLRAIVQCCAYHQKDGCHAVCRHIIVHATREFHG